MSKELEELIKQFKSLMDESMVNMEKINYLREEYNALVEAENKPEYPDGTTGYLSDNKDMSSSSPLVRLINLPDSKFSGTHHVTGHKYADYENFVPLDETILSTPVENTGTCPWEDGDEVRVEFANGTFETDTCPTIWNWSQSRWEERLLKHNPIVRSQLIKRAE